MAVLWDPIENNSIPPETWRFLFNFEVYHYHSLPADLLQTQDPITSSESGLAVKRQQQPPTNNHSNSSSDVQTSGVVVTQVDNIYEQTGHDLAMDNPLRR
jgi:hypothetical protein